MCCLVRCSRALDHALKRCLRAKNVTELSIQTLKRFEGQFGALLVRKTYTFIILSRYGMSEEELLLITGRHPVCSAHMRLHTSRTHPIVY